MNARKTLTALLLGALCLAAVSCGEAAQTPTKDTDAETNPTIPETEAVTEATPQYTDGLPDTDFGGAEFRVRTIENANVKSYMDVAEETGDVLDDALYRRNRSLEERFHIVFKETYADDNSALFKKLVMSGDDAFEIGNLRCVDAINYYADNLMYSISDVPNVDLNKPYWAKKLNESITVGGKQFTAVGAYDINVFDLTYALVFNKAMAADFDMGDLYATVKDGKWTMDYMTALMTEVIADLDGDGVYTKDDRWGYLANPKQVLPNFWIGAGEMSIQKDTNDNPYINMTSERFVNVFTKTFEITRDTGAWFAKTIADRDVPTDNIVIFSEGRALFMDVSLYHIAELRDMETDFGILPYPKYDEAQSDYYSRVSYYWATVVPSTNSKLEMTGTVLEALQCASANTVVPAYYDVALKAKYSRDEASAEMLDLILENRVVDIGDTILCSTIRDGFILSMFNGDKRDIASQVAKKEKTILKQFEKLPQN